MLAVHIASEPVLSEREAFVLCFCGTEFTAGEFPRHLEVYDIWLTGSRNHGLTSEPVRRSGHPLNQRQDLAPRQ